MSALIGHAKAARILAGALEAEAFKEVQSENPDAYAGIVLARLSNAYLSAADRMEQAMREEATGLAGSDEA